MQRLARIFLRPLRRFDANLIVACESLITAAFFLIAFSCVTHATPLSPHLIKVPLGLVWGDSLEKLESMAQPGGFSIIKREEIAGKTVVTIQGLLGAGLKENIFTFQKDGLIEIEYRYGNPKWSAQQYQDFFDSFRRMYDSKYGSGTQLISTNHKELNDLTISLTGYQWSQSSCLLELFYYVAEQSEVHSCRLVSLHYKAP